MRGLRTELKEFQHLKIRGNSKRDSEGPFLLNGEGGVKPGEGGVLGAK